MSSWECGMHTLLVLAIASWAINASSTAAGSMRPPLWARFSSMSEFSSPSVQYLHLILASSPTLTERVIMHNDMNDMTNSVAGTENEIKNSRHVFAKSKRASTIPSSFWKWQNETEKKPNTTPWNMCSCVYNEPRGRWLHWINSKVALLPISGGAGCVRCNKNKKIYFHVPYCNSIRISIVRCCCRHPCHAFE